MDTTEFCNVLLPKTTKGELLTKINNLERFSRQTFYLLYSEFLLRANANPGYRQALSRANLMAIDGKGLEWANWRLRGKGISNSKRPERRKTTLGLIITYIRILINLIFNFFSGFLIIVSRYNTYKETRNQVILGRDFIYDLLKVAEDKKWTAAVIGGNRAVKDALQAKYPNLNLNIWYKDAGSLLMQDIGLKSGLVTNIVEKHKFLNTTNLYQEFPDLIEAGQTLQKLKPDLIIVCLGGASGKQELFIDSLKEQGLTFTLAVGIGAAFDHLGAGEEQKQASKVMEKSGLEWLYRIFTNPRRAYRTWYSIYMLWWLVSLQPFVLPRRKVSLANISC